MTTQKEKVLEDFIENLKILKVYYIDFDSVGKLINAHFKTSNHEEDYSLPSLEEKGPNDHMMVSVDGRDNLDKRDLAQIESGEWPEFRTVNFLNSLCEMGVINSGKYVISVVW